MVKKEITEDRQRKCSPLADIRRFSDGVRLHPRLGETLAFEAGMFLDEYRDRQISRAEISRSLIPVLERLGYIVLIDPQKPLPNWLRDRERKLARRGGMKPIWMPTLTFPSTLNLVPQIQNGKIIWRKFQRISKRKTGRRLGTRHA
jgi:hypothetical protein